MGEGGLFFGMSGWTILFGLAFAVYGWRAIARGRDRGNPPLIGIGVALMVFPYFVTNPWLCFFLGAGLCSWAYRIW